MVPINFTMYIKEPILFYSGIVILTDDIERVVEAIDSHRDFIYNNCSKRGGSYINIKPSVILSI